MDVNYQKVKDVVNYNLCRRDLFWNNVVDTPLEEYIYRIQILQQES